MSTSVIYSFWSVTPVVHAPPPVDNPLDYTLARSDWELWCVSSSSCVCGLFQKTPQIFSGFGGSSRTSPQQYRNCNESVRRPPPASLQRPLCYRSIRVQLFGWAPSSGGGRVQMKSGEVKPLRDIKIQNFLYFRKVKAKFNLYIQ